MTQSQIKANYRYQQAYNLWLDTGIIKDGYDIINGEFVNTSEL